MTKRCVREFITSYVKEYEAIAKRDARYEEKVTELKRVIRHYEQYWITDVEAMMKACEIIRR